MKRLRNCLVVAPLISSMVASATRAEEPQPTPPRILVEASRLLDPRTGNVLSPAAVLVEGNKIKEVGPPSQIRARVPSDTKIVDLGGATVLPGLIDSHTHLVMDDIVAVREAER